MRTKIILNPAADQGRGRRYQDLIAMFGRQYGEVEVALTTGPRHATELAREAALAGYDLVVAAGGDGTVHEVVNGLYQVPHSTAVLGVVPIGSGNDFAYAAGIPLSPEQAIERVFTGKRHEVDLVRIEDDHGRSRVFDNNFGLGFDATVVIETQKVTRVRGFLMYLTAVFRTMTYYYDRPHIEAQFDDETVTQDILFLAVGLGPRGGGGFLLVPDARQDDGLIDSCTVNPINRFTMLRLIPSTLNGSHITSRHVTMRRNQRIRIRCTTPMAIHIDGEVFAYPADQIHAVTLTVLPAALRVIV